MARIPVLRVQQFTKGSLSAIGREVDRAEKNSRNGDIDETRTEYNVAIKDAEGGTLYRAWNAWRVEHGCSEQKINKTMTAFEGIVLTASPEVFQSFGWNPETPEGTSFEVRLKCQDFLISQYNFVRDVIGEDKILSATIHFDEKTPHIQLYYIPAVEYVNQKQYEKDKNGHIVRNEKGSPVYARDKDGKIITERVEGTRINRGSFWSNLGGKNSYNMLQTNHFETLKEEYPHLNLERGKEGSTAEHRTKNQWEKEMMDEVKDNLDNEIAEKSVQVEEIETKIVEHQENLRGYEERLQKYEEMSVDIEQVEVSGKKILGGVILKEDNLNRLKEQAKAYIANKPRIEALNEREHSLDEREQALQLREQAVEKRENSIGDKEAEMLKWEGIYYSQVQEYKYLKVDLRAEVEKEKKQYIELYKEQLALNNEHSKLKSLVAEQSEEITKLKAENASLRVSNEEKVKQAVKTATEPLRGQIEALKEKLTNMAKTISAMLMAMRYIRDEFAGIVSEAFLNATIRKGNDWLAEDGFIERSKNRDSRIVSAVREEVALDLTYKNGSRGKGLYHDNLLVSPAKTFKEAKELFPKCTITNEVKERANEQVL